VIGDESGARQVDTFSRALAAMADEMASASEVVRPSEFWTYLNELGLAQLADRGLRDFKRTLNSNYFQWVPTLRDPQLHAVASHWLRRPSPSVIAARLQDADVRIATRLGDLLRTRFSRRLYAFYVAALWEFCTRRVAADVLVGLVEPEIGDPVVVQHRGRPVTQDLCNSALEFASITEALPEGKPGGSGVVELGSGYGRLAWLFLDRMPGLRYVLVDIPPALAVAQEYLTSVLPDRPAFRFRHIDRFKDVADEFDAAELVFLTPNQLDVVPPMGAGLFINVSSLHEMAPAQIEHYFGQIARHTAGCFYTKQWLRSPNPYDGVTIAREDYPVPSSWTVLFDRVHPIQRRFFEAMYALPEPRR
jgi:putative sugar O-methyltransferase